MADEGGRHPDSEGIVNAPFQVEDVTWAELDDDAAERAAAEWVGGLLRVIVWIERYVRWAFLAFRAGKWLLQDAPPENPRPALVYDPATKYLWRRQADGSYRPSGIKMD